MRGRYIVFVLLAVVAVISYSIVNRPDKTPKLTSTPTPNSTPSIELEDRIKGAFKVDIPSDVEKSQLRDISGGDGSGIVTRDYKNNNFELMVLADLKDPDEGTVYQAWLETTPSPILLGDLVQVKGGWSLEYSSKTNYSTIGKIIISQEEKRDQTVEKKVLEASF